MGIPGTVRAGGRGEAPGGTSRESASGESARLRLVTDAPQIRATPAPGAIKIRGLWHEYGSKIVLEAVNLDIAPKTFCSITGPSGCGKSTFLRILLGQTRPTRGQILLDGAALPAEPGPDRGVVF